MSGMEKPVCGSEGEVGEYDLGLHVAGLCRCRRILDALGLYN